MEEIVINEEDYDKFIFKGSLALESYNDVDKNYEELFNSFNEKLRQYRNLSNKTLEDKKNIVNELISTMQNIGKENFIIYEDGDVEYNEEGRNI